MGEDKSGGYTENSWDECKIINRHGWAGLFYKHLCHWLIDCLSHPFTLNLQNIISPKHKIWGAEILRECLAPDMCHVSHVKCHVSHVEYHLSQHHYSQAVGPRDLKFWDNLHHMFCLSGVTCQVSGVKCHMSKKLSEIFGANWWSVCYQQSLPRHLAYKM